MVSYEELFSAWENLTEFFHDKPRLQDNLKKADLFLSIDGEMMILAIEDEVNRDWLNEIGLSLIQERLEKTLRKNIQSIRAVSSEELDFFRQDQFHWIAMDDSMDRLWWDWKGRRLSYDYMIDNGIAKDKGRTRRLEEAERRILDRINADPSLFVDSRFEDFRLPFYFQIIHGLEERIHYRFTVPPAVDLENYSVSNWHKYFLDPDDSWEVLEELTVFSEEEIEVAIEDGASLLRDFIIRRGQKYLEEWENEKHQTYYDRLVNSCLGFDWSSNPVEVAFEPFMQEFFPQEYEETAAFVERQCCERVEKLLYFSKKTENKYENLGKTGFINAIEQAFLSNLIDKANARR